MSTALTRTEAIATAEKARSLVRTIKGDASNPISPGNMWDNLMCLGGGGAAGVARGLKPSVGPVPTDVGIAALAFGIGAGMGSDSVAKIGVGAGSFALGRWAESMTADMMAKRAAMAAK